MDDRLDDAEPNQNGISSPSDICAVCQKAVGLVYQQSQILVGVDTDDSGLWLHVIHHGSLQSFEGSILQGCKLCCFLKRHENRYQRGFPHHWRCWRFVVVPPQWKWLWDIQVNGEDDDRHPVGDDCSFSLYEWVIDYFSGHRKLRVKNYNTVTSSNSPQCLALVRQWLSDCHHLHEGCERDREPSLADWMPTRLIYCGGDSQSAVLREGSQIPSRTPYMTLSHCWGQLPNPLRLTSSVLEAWKIELPDLGDMRSLQDAIDITRACDIQYLWIDSLCIVQDSEEDWKRESQLMAQVYQFSYCNISATSARNDAEGCFLTRIPGDAVYTSFDFKLQDNLLQNHRLSSGDIAVVEISHDSLSALHEKEGGPITERGWVLQERILSPRVVHFCKTQVCWECDHSPASEQYPDGEWMDDSAGKLFQKIKERPDELRRGRSHNHLDDLPPPLSAWLEILDLYRATKLTKSDDVLIAVSAIARKIHKSLNVRYFAGIFESHVILQLCWKSREGPRLGCKSPSWSWSASIEREGYDLFHPNPVELAEYRAMQVELRDNDPFGRVVRGSIRLEGLLLPAKLSHHPDREYEPKTDVWFLSDGWRGLLWSHIEFCADDRSIWEGCEEIHNCYFFPLLFNCLTEPRERTSSDELQLEGLHGIVLNCVRPGVFRRIGYLNGGMDRFDSLLLSLIGGFLSFEDTIVRGFRPHESRWTEIIIE